MSLSENALKVFQKLYYRGDEKTPQEVFRRVAKFATQGEKDGLEDHLSMWMVEGYLRFNTPANMNCGWEENPQNSACFCGDLNDDLLSIFEADKEAGIIYSKGSGIGLQYGNLRETGANLSRGGQSSGPFAFLRKLAMTGWAVKSGGRSRRAAHLAMMYDHHPDVLDFITFKAEHNVPFMDGGLLDGMNLSVAISDAFMQAVEKQKIWNLIGVVDKKIKKTVPAIEMFELIAKNATKNGEPGVWFIDKANEDNMIPASGRINCTNPCAEQSLLAYQCCCLASINLARCIRGIDFDFDSLQLVVRDSVRALDNLIDLSGYPTPKYEDMAKRTRPIGLGIMGLADVLVKMGLRYDSDAGILFAEKVQRFITHHALMMSSELAFEKGSFEYYEDNREAVQSFVKKFYSEDLDVDKKFLENVEKYGLRNSQLTTIAPTGSISISCDCSQGMEPLFALCYDKKISDSNEHWTIVNPVFEELYKNTHWYKKGLQEIIENHGSCQGCPSVPKKVQEVCVTAHDISWKRRIRMQAALQRWVTNSISSTINLPKGTPWQTVAEIYMDAWKSGLKGITVYVDGCRKNQPVQFGKKQEDPIPEQKKWERPDELVGRTRKVKTHFGSLYVTVNEDPTTGRPVEIFAGGGKNGSSKTADLSAISRVMSIALQEGASLERITRTILGLDDNSQVSWVKLDSSDEKPVKITSIYDAIAKLLRRFWIDTSQESLPVPVEECSGLACPSCGGPASMREGCIWCSSCGSSCG